MKFLLYLFLFQTILSCSSFTNDPEILKDSKFIPGNVNGWKRLSNSNVDYAYYKDTTKSFILIGSLCNKYKSSSNRDLLYSMLGTIKFEILSTRNSSLFNREALYSTLSTKVDGIQTYVSTVLLRKDHCSYDFVLINTNKSNLDKDTIEFNNFVTGSNL